MPQGFINSFGFAACPPFVGVTEPDDFAGLARWYKAETFALANGATVATSWIDQSVNASNATPSVGFESVYSTTVFSPCRPTVFMGINGVHNFAFDSGAITLTDFTVLIVATATSDTMVLSNSTLNRQIRFQFGNVNQAIFYDGSGVIFSPILTYPGTAIRMTGWKRAGSTVSFFENDLAVAGGSTGSAAAFDQIGLKDSGPLNYNLAEIVIYTSALSTADVLTLYTDYFKPKYGLTP